MEELRNGFITGEDKNKPENEIEGMTRMKYKGDRKYKREVKDMEDEIRRSNMQLIKMPKERNWRKERQHLKKQ